MRRLIIRLLYMITCVKVLRLNLVIGGTRVKLGWDVKRRVLGILLLRTIIVI